MRGDFAVEEPMGQRWEAALDLLGRGESVALAEVTYRRTSDAIMEAAVVSSWRAANLTEDRAREDLDRAIAMTERLLADDPAFREVVGTARLDYVLVDDYDTGSIALCRVDGDDLIWLVPPPGQSRT